MGETQADPITDALKEGGFGLGIVDNTEHKKKKITRFKKTLSKLIDNQMRMQNQINSLQNHINVLQHDQKTLIEDMRDTRNGIEEDEDESLT